MFKRQEHKYGLSEGTCHVSMFVFLKLDQKIKIIKKNKKKNNKMQQVLAALYAHQFE